MRTVYIAMNQPLTTKYLKKGGSDIDQLIEDINELKGDVAQIEEIDTTQNTDITNLKSDVRTLQTSDLTQNTDIDKLRHQLYFRIGYKNYQSTVLKHFPDHTLFKHSRLIAFKNKTKNFYNSDDKYSLKVNYLSLNNKMTLDFRAGKTYYYSINTSLYVYIPEWRFAGGSGIEIINGLGEYVLTTGITFHFVYEIFPSTNLPNEQLEEGEIVVKHIDLRAVINNYGTDYYKEHINDDFGFINCFSNSH